MWLPVYSFYIFLGFILLKTLFKDPTNFNAQLDIMVVSKIIIFSVIVIVVRISITTLFEMS